MSCDLLVFAPHPDDAELHCGGVIAAHTRAGASVVVVDCTAGEAASRGSPAQRAEEATAAAEILGLSQRLNLGLPDGRLLYETEALIAALVDCLRQIRPRLILGMAGTARHPDHVALGQALRPACKAAALHGFRPHPERPPLAAVPTLQYEAELPLPPQLLIPITEADWQRKRKAIAAYASQFIFDSTAPPTSISQPDFLSWVEARGRCWGQHAGAAYAEALIGLETPRLANLLDLC